MQNTPSSVIRNTLKRQRQQLSNRQRRQLSLQACQLLCDSTLFQDAHAIAFYSAHRGELDLSSAIRKALTNDKACYLPVLDGQEILFVRITASSKMCTNQYGIAEPLTQREVATTTELDLIVVPSVAVDKQGHRLGMGGGYYDRTFAFLQQQHKRPAEPHLCAAVYHFQLLNSLQAAAHDVNMNSIVTETELLFIP